MLTLTHHGAVTGSCHELTLHGPGGGKSGILVDCGLFQGDETTARQRRGRHPVSCDHLMAVDYLARSAPITGRSRRQAKQAPTHD